MPRCDLVIAVSQSVARILAERYSIPEPMVIYNAQPYVDAALRRKSGRVLPAASTGGSPFMWDFWTMEKGWRI